MRVDRRFDALVRQDPQRFDVMAAAQRQISRYEQEVARQPRSLDALTGLVAACLDTGHYEEAARVAGAVLGRVQDPQAFHAAYDDDATALSGLLDSYARAVMATQPWDDAAGAMELAAEAPEHGSPKVSNLINLGWFYARLGRPGEAVRALAGVPLDDTGLTPLDRMQWHAARVAAAVVGDDPQRVRESLGVLSLHRTDASEAYQDALLRAGSEDAAARLLIERLHDHALYRQALLDVQIYAEPPAPLQVLQQRARWRRIVSRPDVQRAILKVGHIESWPLPAQELWEGRGR
jgi:hypothetical protein